MTVSLGKRKREGAQDDSGDEETLRSLFQRAFEAKFRPLENAAPIVHAESDGEEEFEEDDDESSASEWGGLSEDENTEVVEMHNYSTSSKSVQDAQKSERKAFMTSKPPSSSISSPKIPLRKEKAVAEDDPTEAANVKHDLALQRLLKESHLLDANSFSGETPQVSGRSRLKALDLRLKDLGAKNASNEQQKMPLSHRRGITAKAADREQRRRKDARENGVILEKVKQLAKGNQERRTRSVGGPAVGKFRGGTLRLGTKDLRSIQGPAKDRRRR